MSKVRSKYLLPVVKCNNGTVQGLPGSPGFWTQLSDLQQTRTSRSPHLSSSPDLESSSPVDTVAQTPSWRKQMRHIKYATKMCLLRLLPPGNKKPREWCCVCGRHRPQSSPESIDVFFTHQILDEYEAILLIEESLFGT